MMRRVRKPAAIQSQTADKAHNLKRSVFSFLASNRHIESRETVGVRESLLGFLKVIVITHMQYIIINLQNNPGRFGAMRGSDDV